MGRRGGGSFKGARCARLIGGALLALAGLAPAWVAAPPPAVAAAHPTGGVVAWGDGTKGQTTVPQEARSGVISVAAGCGHSLALRADGRVIAWGDNSRGQANVPAAALSGVAGIVAGCDHSLALKSNGTIVAWGDNAQGQLNVPSLPRGWRWSNIAAGSSHSVGVARTSYATDVYAWGDTSYGQGQVTPSDEDSTGWYDWYNVADVEAGGNATIARMSGGSVRVWGDTSEGVCAMFCAVLPNRTTIPAGATNVVAMSMGQGHALVVRSNGTVVAWGDNAVGQASVPRGLSKVKAVAAGGYHSLALKTDGTLVGWGANDAGQRTGPPPRGKSRYIWIASGLQHSLAVGQLAPAAPTGVTATPWDGAVTVSWTAPADVGLDPVTAYTVTATPGGKTCTTVKVLSCTIGGLTNSTPYVFSVTGRNSVGDGSAGVSLPAAPSVPALVTLEPSPTPTPVPSPVPTATPVPGGGTGGGGGGLPLVPVAIVILLGVGAAIIAYKPSAFIARGRATLARLTGKTSLSSEVAAIGGADTTTDSAGTSKTSSSRPRITKR